MHYVQRLSISGLAALVLTPAAMSVVIRVDVQSPVNGPGTTWSNAYSNLQSALAVANSGDSLWVADGTYKPTAQTDPPDARSATFSMETGVKLYGGFQGISEPGGGETQLSQRSPERFRSVLSGDIGVVGTTTDNAYHVVTANGVDNTAHLNGFVIRDGVGDMGGFQSFGAGLFSTFAAPTVVRCTFTSNLVTSGGGAVGIEGGYSELQGPSFLNCIFSKNTSTYHGGGILCQSARIELRNCLATDNTASNNGGFVFIDTGSTYVIVNCTVYKNAANGSSSTSVMMLAGTGNVTNSIAWANTNFAGGNEVAQLSATGSPHSISYCDIQYLSAYAGNFNISVDPEFVNAATGNFQLKYLSKLLNNGNGSAVAADHLDVDDDGNTTEPGPDLAINPRKVNPASCVDIGCYENQTAGTCYGDITNSTGGGPDGVVDSYDQDLVNSFWGTPGGVADLAPLPCGDSNVDVSDLLALLGVWGPCP
ncbi:MAG: hypothetical protein L0219_03920 [Phycisphaerales bacterium]|nr:hypothetical protein [Phycisphaerales bacterium]MCI0677222.1 hypothetical protein [Phycisphaerales bacterium]